MKHLKIEYTTEGGSRIVLFDGEVAEVNWSDGSGTVRVEGRTSAAASSGLNLLEMLTGKRAEPEPEAPAAAPEPARKAAPRAARKAAPRSVEAEPVG